MISGDIALIACSLKGLRVIRIDDPGEPEEEGWFGAEGHPYGVYIDGNYLYQAYGESGLVILDISDPDEPQEICRIEFDSQAKFVCVDGPEFDGHKVNFDLMMKRLSAYKSMEQKEHERYNDHRCRIAETKDKE